MYRDASLELRLALAVAHTLVSAAHSVQTAGDEPCAWKEDRLNAHRPVVPV